MVSSSMKKIRGIKKCPVCKKEFLYNPQSISIRRKVLILSITAVIPVGEKMVTVNIFNYNTVYFNIKGSKAIK